MVTDATPESVAAVADLGRPTARKSGRDIRWPYVPIIDHGRYTKQVLGVAFAQRSEAVTPSAAAVDAVKEMS